MEATINRASPPPATLDPAWLPADSDWPELNELRAEHLRLRRAMTDAAQAVTALEGRFAAEDNLRAVKAREALLAGRDPEPVDGTPPEERTELLRERGEQSRAASAAFFDHVERVLAVVGARGSEWISDLDGAERQIEQQIREAEAVVAGLRRRLAEPSRLRHWIERTRNGAARPVDLIAFATIPAPPPTYASPAAQALADGERVDRLMREDLRRSRPLIDPAKVAALYAEDSDDPLQEHFARSNPSPVNG